MINHIRKRDSIHVYFKDDVDTAGVVDDTMLLSTNREKDVNIGSGEPNCNEELNCNERVNGGIRETFTELSRESNIGLDFSGSSDACAKSGKSSKTSGANDTDNSLGSEGALRAEPKDKKVRNIKAWYRKYEGEK
ncbi:hypothetical protein PVK06_043786 [Gossypium arboreum]|uniref:Uncharacterized protein n=1 Tax=Gossypium arboreum TaxID=29729 RepID=A0ABR0MPS7_GOSAR|nr:hypothetical protein PVK06_043786 [Gossypium arboreum]